MRKLTWLLGAMLLLLSLTGCGNKVDSESIRSYLESSYYRTTAEWNDRSMQWFRKESNEYATSGEVVVTLDITGHYDFYINGKQHYTFDIEKDSGQYYMRNFTYYNRPYSTDRLEASFEEKQLSFDWPEYSVTAPYWVGVYDENIKLEIMNGRLYFSRELISPVS